MDIMSSVAVVCCALFFFQHAAAGPLDNQIEDTKRTLDFPETYSLKGHVDVIGFNYSFAIWVSEPLNSMRVRVAMRGIAEKQMLVLGNEGTYGSLREYTTLFGEEVCNFVKGTPDKPITVKSKLSSDDLHFDDVEIIKGEELEKWVKESEEMGAEFYIKRTEKGVVPVRAIVTIKSTQKLVIRFNVEEYSSKPVSDSVFVYDSSSPCNEVQVSNSNIMSPGLSGKLMKREVHDKSDPLNIMSQLVGHYYV